VSLSMRSIFCILLSQLSSLAYLLTANDQPRSPGVQSTSLVEREFLEGNVSLTRTNEHLLTPLARLLRFAFVMVSTSSFFTPGLRQIRFKL
jgi:hypothetical protein